MHSAELLHRFDAWEEAVRGYRWWPHRVPLEPIYQPFLGERRVRVGIVDDARKPGLWERLKRRPPGQVSPLANEESADPPERTASSELSELQLLVPKDFGAGGELARRCLISISSLGERLSFEVLGQHGQTAVQIACDASS